MAQDPYDETIVPTGIPFPKDLGGRARHFFVDVGSMRHYGTVFFEVDENVRKCFVTKIWITPKIAG